MLPIASNYKFASKERGHKPNDIKVARAAACGTCQVAASAGGRPAAGTRHLAKGVFVLALLGKKKRSCSLRGLPESYARCHETLRPQERPLEHAE